MKKQFVLIVLTLFAIKSNFAQDSKSDLVVIFDTSGSMMDTLSNRQSKLEYSKEKVAGLLDVFSNQNEFSFKLIEFQNEAILTDFGHLNTTKYSTVVKKHIGALQANGGTPLADSIRLAADLFISSDKENQSLVIISDGQDDRGIEAVVSALDYFNSKTAGKVLIQFFAIGVEERTWAEFKSLSDQIKVGTLYLVESADSGGDYFSFSADAVSGNWNSSQIRSNYGKRLGHISAGKAIVTTGLGVSAERDYDGRLVSIDWAKLKTEDPAIYERLKNWFNRIEAQFRNSYISSQIDYLLNEVIRKEVGDVTEYANREAYKQQMKMIFDRLMYGLRPITESNNESSSPNPLDYYIPSLRTSSASAGAVDLTLDYLILEYLHLTRLDQTFLGEDPIMSGSLSTVAQSVAIPLILLKYDGPVMYDTTTAHLALTKRRVLIATLLGSSVSGYSSTTDASSSGTAEGIFASEALAREKDDIIEGRERTQYYEVAKFKTYVASKEAEESFAVIFPGLTNAEVRRRIETASNLATPLERAKVLFAGIPEYTEKLVLAEVLSEALVNEIKKSSIARLSPGLRSPDHLPSDVQAYFLHLRRTVDDEALDKEIELFLQGVE